MNERVDIAVVGAGAAGLMAAIWAGRTARTAGRPVRIRAYDGARTLGAKILVAGGGRCNVTHHEVSERDFAGASPNAVRNVLRRFGVDDTVRFFEERGVRLKREETGKLFPTTDRARTVLDALLVAAHDAGAEIVHPWRIDRVERHADGFTLFPPPDDPHAHPTLAAHRVILAMGGRSLPKSGSDGRGYDVARSLGHSVTKRIFPALVPLTLPRGYFLCELSGVTLDAELTLCAASGRKLRSFTDSTLLTHFGLSGPSVLNISRFWIDARRDDPGAALRANWLPGETLETMDAALLAMGAASPLRALRERLPERLLRALCAHAGADPNAAANTLTREQRRALARALCAFELPVTGDRGFAYAEATAGGVPLAEVRLDTMESRVCPGLHLCGEILDVDGRIGGFNFQWAWASGFVAGSGAARAFIGAT